MNRRGLNRDSRAFFGTATANGQRLYYATDGTNSVYYLDAITARDAVESHNRLNQLGTVD